VLEGALKRFPQSLALREALLLYLIKSGRIQEAERLAALTGSKIKDKAAAHIYLGQVWLKAGYPAQADVSFTESLHIQETPEAWAGAAQWPWPERTGIWPGLFSKGLESLAEFLCRVR